MTSSIYSSLDASRKQIRLVQVLPSQEPSSQVQCNLRVSSLNNGPCYDALSYCWGSPNATSTIFINGVEVSVTDNLSQALHHFREVGDGDSTPFWIDAICINQRDIGERNCQVAMMGDIYQQAGTVHIWLGGPQLVSQDGMRALEELSEYTAKDSSGRGAPWPAPGDGAGPAKLEALAALARNVYWRRTWILQEISFAENIIVHGNENRIILQAVGPGRLPFIDLRDRLLISQDALGNARFVAEIFEPMTMAAWSSKVALFVSEGDPAFLRLPQVLFMRFRHSLATDPRDKIYGMLSLLPNVFDGIRPDYSKSMKQLYAEATLELMRKSRDLEALCQACSGSSDLPSWVPDFRLPSRIPKNLTDYWITCRAGGIAQMDVDIIDDDLLRTKAFHVDRISHIERGGGFDPKQGYSEIRRPIRRWRTLFDQSAEQLHTEPIDREHIFWRAVCGGGADGEAFEVEHKVACQQLMSYTGTEAPKVEIPNFYNRDFVTYLSKVVQENDFFVTARGHAGLVPMDCAEVDDTIMIFAGANVPFVTRKTGSEGTDVYVLRAPCFVENHVIERLEDIRQGIMDGGIILARAQCDVDDEAAINKAFEDIVLA